jgi:hypothetical protein
MIKSITSIAASHPVQFLNTSPHSVNQASQSVLRVMLPSLNPNSWMCCHVRSLFVLDSVIHVLSDSYPVTWLAKVVALLPPVADSLALYGLCGLALSSIRIRRLANGWPSKWGTTNECRIWSRYFCPVKVPSMAYKSILQFREEHPETVKPPPPNAVVPTIWSCWNVVFRGLHTRRRPSTGFNKKRLSSDQYTLCHDLIFHPIWSRTHWSLAVLWCIVSSGRFIGLLARNLALLRCLLTVRLLMRPLTIHLLRSVFVVLNGCCLASLLRSLPSLAVIFIDLPVLLRSFTLPVWFTCSFNRTMTEWLTLNRSAVCLVGYITPYHSNRLPSLCIWQFSTCHVVIFYRSIS